MSAAPDKRWKTAPTVTLGLLAISKVAAAQILLAVFAVSALSVTGCRPAGRAYPPNTTFALGQKLAEFTESGVQVVVSLESDPQGNKLFRATFTPLEPGFHLYGKDLPPTGIKGIGLPTQLDIPKQSALRVAGESFADEIPHDQRIDVLSLTLPIYPEGPVTLHVPVEISRAQGNTSAQLAVTYIACQTSGKCLRPVKNKLVEIQIPNIR